MIGSLSIVVIWALAAALLMRLLTMWDQLPQRVAVHFNLAMQPNAWSSRSMMTLLIVLVVLGHAVLATWLIHSVGSQFQMIAPIQMGVAAILVSVFWQVIRFNVDGTPFQPVWIVVPVLVMVALAGALAVIPGFHHSLH